MKAAKSYTPISRSHECIRTSDYSRGILSRSWPVSQSSARRGLSQNAINTSFSYCPIRHTPTIWEIPIHSLHMSRTHSSKRYSPGRNGLSDEVTGLSSVLGRTGLEEASGSMCSLLTAIYCLLLHLQLSVFLFGSHSIKKLISYLTVPKNNPNKQRAVEKQRCVSHQCPYSYSSSPVLPEKPSNLDVKLNFWLHGGGLVLTICYRTFEAFHYLGKNQVEIFVSLHVSSFGFGKFEIMLFK